MAQETDHNILQKLLIHLFRVFLFLNSENPQNSIESHEEKKKSKHKKTK